MLMNILQRYIDYNNKTKFFLIIFLIIIIFAELQYLIMLKYLKKLPLSLTILIGLVLGLVVGFLCFKTGNEQFVKFWIQPWGEIFLRLLKLIAVPVVFLSIVCGIFGIGNIRDFSRLAGTTFLLYIITTILAISLGLFLVNTFKPGKVFDDTEQQELQKTFDNTIAEQQQSAQEVKEQGPLHFLVDIVPENIFKAASDNSKMLQIIFVAILMGLVILIIPDEKTSVVQTFFIQLNDIFLSMVEIIMKAAPLGVFALMAGMMVEFSGSIGVLSALGLYAITVISGLILITFLLYPLIIGIFTKTGVVRFLKGIFPAQIVAFTTSSSAVTLPVTKRQVEKELGVPPKVSGFVLPLGMTINMDGTSLYQVVAVVFISQVFGIELSFSQQMFLVLLAVLSSIGTPGIPGGSIVMLLFILSSVGVPAEGLALILGIDRPLDMMRTVTNVTGDSMICCLLKNKLPDETLESDQ
jgi:proton glutamate symport protein